VLDRRPDCLPEPVYFTEIDAKSERPDNRSARAHTGAPANASTVFNPIAHLIETAINRVESSVHAFSRLDSHRRSELGVAHLPRSSRRFSLASTSLKRASNGDAKVPQSGVIYQDARQDGEHIRHGGQSDRKDLAVVHLQISILRHYNLKASWP
jgi:hypothetical protein